jgi:hypothetical protein
LAGAGLTAIALSACGGSGSGFIPGRYAGPLEHDFENVLEAARTGNGACKSTEIALKKTEADFQALPPDVSSALKARLRTGISYLTSEAIAECETVTKTTTTTTTTRTKSHSNTEITEEIVVTQSSAPVITESVTAPSTTSKENPGGTAAPTGGGPGPGGSEATNEPGAANEGKGASAEQENRQ